MMPDNKMIRSVYNIKYLPDGISFIKWKDTKAVHLISNFHGLETTTVNRINKDGTSVPVKCPTSVIDYK